MSTDSISNQSRSAKPKVDVTDPLEFHQWLLDNVGGAVLPGFFVRDGMLVRVPRRDDDEYRPLTTNPLDDDGPAQVRPADGQRLRAVLAREVDSYKWVKVPGPGGAFDEQPCLPLAGPCGLYVAGVGEPGAVAPHLTGVVHAPVVRPDGSILDTPGYDTSTGLLYLPARDLVVPKVPERPTRDNVEEAVKTLCDPVRQFPWVEPSDQVTYVGSLLISPVMRPVIPPPYPGVALSAHSPGSGKSLLSKIAHMLYGGVFRAEFTGGDEEIRKAVSSILLSTTAPLITLDNISGRMRSGTFAALLTTARWNDRTLGSLGSAGLTNDRIWVITGNNISLGGDLPRRFPVWIRIDPDVEDPHLRTGFDIPNLPAYVLEHRGRMLAAALTLVRHWVAEGRPLAGPERHDDYGPYLRSVAGLCELAGLSGDFAPTATHRKATEVNSEDTEMAEFLAALFLKFPDPKGDPSVSGVFRARDIVDLVEYTHAKLDSAHRFGVTTVKINETDRTLYDTVPALLSDKIGRGAGFGRSLGWWFSNRIGRWTDGYVIRRPEQGGHGSSFEIRRAAK